MSGRDDGVGKEGGRKEDSGASDVGWEEGDLDFLDDLVDGHAFHETHHGEELVHGRAQKEEYVSSRRGKSRERLKSEKDKGRVRGTREEKGRREGANHRARPRSPERLWVRVSWHKEDEEGKRLDELLLSARQLE
jgi:hypothetical protein